MYISAARRRGVISSLVSLALLLGLLALFQAARPPVARASVSAGNIVFTRDRFAKCPNNTQIAQLKPDGKVTDLSDCQTDDQMAAISTDGSRIVYQSLGHVDAKGSSEPVLDGLYVMNSNGTDKTQLTQEQASDSGCPCGVDVNPAWNPSGTQIVFSRYYSTSSGYVYNIDKINADGSGLTTLASESTNGSFMLTGGPSSWSPDGTKIVYTYQPSGGSPDLYVMNADGSNKHELVSAAYDPTWSPDGSKIYFDNDSDIFSVNADGSGLTQLTDSYQYGGQNYEPTVSANGGTVVYTDLGQLYIISSSANKEAGTPLTSSAGDDENEPAYAWGSWPNANTKTIVGLGDSVAAGEGINYGFKWTGSKWKRTGPSNPTWMNTTPALGANYQQCHQSGHGYPNLITLNGGNYELYNMACTGASALQNNASVKPEDGGVLDPEQFNSKDQPYPENPGPDDPSQAMPAELGAISNCNGCSALSKYFGEHNPSIVLLTMGANDVDFPYWIKACYDLFTTDCNTKAHTNLLDSQLAIEKADLATTLDQLNAWASSKSKNLRVLVTDYYNPFDTSNMRCVDYRKDGVQLLEPNEVTWLQNGLNQLNSNINADVSQAQTVDTNLTVSLVDLSGNYGGSDVMSGHKWCSSDPWVYGVSIDYGIPPGTNPAPFHPTPEGQDAIYHAVDAVLNSPT